MWLWLRGHIQMISFMYLVWLLVAYGGTEEMVTVRATCESTGLGEAAGVTCHYRENVVEAADVSAVSLLHDTNGKLERVVECHRFQNNGFDCIHKSGYTLNGTISDQMIINIPRARPEHQGTYYCEIGIQQTEYQMESCNLQYKEANDATTSTPPLEQNSDDHLKGDTGVDALMIVVTVLFLVQMVITLFAVLLFVRWIRRRRRYLRQQDTDVDKLGDNINSLPPASNTDDGDGPPEMDFGQIPYNLTEDTHFRFDVSIKDGKLRLVAYNGSNANLSQLDSKK